MAKKDDEIRKLAAKQAEGGKLTKSELLSLQQAFGRKVVMPNGQVLRSTWYSPAKDERLKTNEMGPETFKDHVKERMRVYAQSKTPPQSVNDLRDRGADSTLHAYLKAMREAGKSPTSVKSVDWGAAEAGRDYTVDELKQIQSAEGKKVRMPNGVELQSTWYKPPALDSKMLPEEENRLRKNEAEYRKQMEARATSAPSNVSPDTVHAAMQAVRDPSVGSGNYRDVRGLNAMTDAADKVAGQVLADLKAKGTKFGEDWESLGKKIIPHLEERFPDAKGSNKLLTVADYLQDKIIDERKASQPSVRDQIAGMKKPELVRLAKELHKELGAVRGDGKQNFTRMSRNAVARMLIQQAPTERPWADPKAQQVHEGKFMTAFNRAFDRGGVAANSPASTTAATDWRAAERERVDAGTKRVGDSAKDRAQVHVVYSQARGDMPATVHEVFKDMKTAQAFAEAHNKELGKGLNHANKAFINSGTPADLAKTESFGHAFQGKPSGWSDEARAASAKVRAVPVGMDGKTRAERAGRASKPAVSVSVPEGATNAERFLAHYQAELAARVQADPAKYRFTKDNVPERASAMVEGLKVGASDHKGAAVQATAKALGIKPTLGAIKAFLTDQPPPAPKPATEGLSAREMTATKRAIAAGQSVKSDVIAKATNAQLQALDDAGLAARRASTGNGNADWSKIRNIEAWREQIRDRARQQTADAVNPLAANKKPMAMIEDNKEPIHPDRQKIAGGAKSKLPAEAAKEEAQAQKYRRMAAMLRESKLRPVKPMAMVEKSPKGRSKPANPYESVVKQAQGQRNVTMEQVAGSGKRGTQNPENLKAIVANRKKNAKGDAGKAAAQFQTADAVNDTNAPAGKKANAPGKAKTTALESAAKSAGITIPDMKGQQPDKTPWEKLVAETDAARGDKPVPKRQGIDTSAPGFKTAHQKALDQTGKRQQTYQGEPGGENLTGKSRQQLLREAQQKGIPGAGKLETRTLAKRLGYGGLKYALPLGLAAGAVIAMNRSAEAGESKGQQVIAGATEVGKGVAVAGGFMAAGAGLSAGLMRAGVTAAKAVPGANLIMMAGGAIHGAATAEKGQRLAGAAKGAWDMSLPGAIVNTGLAVKDAATSTIARASGPSRLTDAQTAQYAAAAKRYGAMKQAAITNDAGHKRAGWSNAARIAAAKARGVTDLPYGGDPTKGPAQWAPGTTSGMAEAMKKRA